MATVTIRECALTYDEVVHSVALSAICQKTNLGIFDDGCDGSMRAIMSGTGANRGFR